MARATHDSTENDMGMDIDHVVSSVAPTRFLRSDEAGAVASNDMADDSHTETLPDTESARPKLTMAAGSFLDLNAEDMVRACASVDALSGLGLRLSGEHHLDRARWAEFAASVTAVGLEVFDLEVHRIGSSPGPHLATADDLVAAAAAIGARHVLVVADVAERDLVEQELARIVAAATERGIGVGLEYMAWTTPSFVEDARYLADATGCTVVVDVLHHTRIGATADDIRRIVHDGRLGWVQICDAGRPVEQLVHEARHLRRPPGTGQLPLEDLLSAVPSSTTFSIEVQSDDLASVEPETRAHLLTAASRSVLERVFSR